MANQRQIAEALGVSQGTVSLALRGSPSISEKVREQVINAAKQMGYQPTMYANRLMSHIRSGKKLSDRDTIALIVSRRSLKDWIASATYREFYQGVTQKAFELGLQIEIFFLDHQGMSDTKVDRILYARGISGIIMAPPYHGNRSLKFHWSRYVPIGVGFGWQEQDLSRVVFDPLSNYFTAFNKLRKLGYKRIGTVLTERIIHGNPQVSKWHTGHLDCQNRIPQKERIPAFAGTDHDATPEEDKVGAEQFAQWVRKWTPDAVLTIAGSEKRWLDAMQLKCPDDIGLACLAKPAGSDIAGIDERSSAVGAAALEQVAAKIFHNEFGLPANPTTMMVHGCWVDGPTIKQQT